MRVSPLTAGRTRQAARFAAALSVTAATASATLGHGQGQSEERQPAGGRGASAMSQHPIRAYDALGGAGRPCTPLRYVGAALVRGGCELVVRGAPARITVATMVGPVPFRACTLEFRLHLGTRGRAALTDQRIYGQSPCNDALACDDPRRPAKDLRLPWTGAVDHRATGSTRGYILRTAVCLDTCLGRFEGPLDLNLTSHKGAWRLEARGATVGDTGWGFDGSLDVSGDLAIHG
jgi:hypothetical protein